MDATLFPKLGLLDCNHSWNGLDLTLAVFDTLPKGIINDSHLWYFSHGPGFWRVGPRHPVPRLRVLLVAQTSFLVVAGCTLLFFGATIFLYDPSKGLWRNRKG